MPHTKFKSLIKASLICMTGLAISSGWGTESAHAAAPDLEIYAELARTMGVSVSPNGKYLAMLGPYKNKRGIFIYDLSTENAKPKVIPTPEGSIVKTLSWGSDKHVIYLATFNRKGQGKMRKYGVRFSRWASTNMETGNTVIMMDDRLNTGNATAGSRTSSSLRRSYGGAYISRLENDPDHILMGWAEYKGKPVFRHFKVNLDSGKEGMVRSLDIKTSGVLLNPTGSQLLARSEYNDRTGKYAVYADKLLLSRSNYNPATREYTVTGSKGQSEKLVYERVFDTERNPTVFPVQVLPDSGKILMFEDELERPRFFTIDPITGVEAEYSLGVPTPSGYDYNLISDPYTDAMIGVTYTDDYTKVIYTAEPYIGWQRKLKKAFPGKRTRIISRTKSNDMITVFVSGPNDPGTYYLYEPKRGQVSPLGERYPELSSSQVARTERINYSARDGLKVPGYVTYPVGKSASSGPMPLVVMPHGGPVGPRDDAEFDFWAQFIASRGYAVFKPQFRGSGGFGYSHKEKGYGEFGTGMVTDTIDGVKYLISKNVVNPDKICVTGASYGGYQALQLPVVEPDMFKCAISVNGVSDVLEILKFESARSGSQNSGVIKFWNRIIGDYHNDRDKMKDISPAQNVDKIKAEILLVHGEDDLTVPINQTEIMSKKLKKNRQGGRIIKLPDDDHNLSLADSRRKLLEESEKLFAKHLK